MRDFRVWVYIRGSIGCPPYNGYIDVRTEDCDSAEDIARGRVYRNFEDRLVGPYDNDLLVEKIETKGK